MAKQNSLNPNNNKQQAANGINYAAKPAKIGPLIKHMTRQRGWTPKQTAGRVNMSIDKVYRTFKRTCLSLPDTMTWSEVFGEELLLLYRSNVPPPPDPCEPLRKEIEALRKENTELENKRNLGLEEIIRLKAQLELLKEQVKDFAGKK